MEILTYLQLFAGSWCAALLYFFPGIITYKQFVTIIAVLSAVSILVQIYKNKWLLSKNFAVTLLLILGIIFAYYLTSIIYGGMNETYISYFLVLGGQTAPAMLTAVFIAENMDIQYRIKRLAPLVSVVFSFIAFQAVIRPTGTTNVGYINNENGLTYNSAAYLIAYAASLASYYVIYFDEIDWPKLFKFSFVRIFMTVLVFIDFFLVLIAGGRGGLVLFTVLAIVAIYSWQKKNNSSAGRMMAGIITIIVIGIVGVWVVRLAAHSNIVTSGFRRILLAIEAGDTSNRDIVYRNAIAQIKESPLIGHGIGSDYFTLGYYAHNLFLDALIETGILGTVVIVFIIYHMIKRLSMLCKKDNTNLIWIMFALYGLVQSMISGYYLAEIPIFWTAVFVFCSSKYTYDENEGL